MRPWMCKALQPRRQSPGCRHRQMAFRFLRRRPRWEEPAVHRQLPELLALLLVLWLALLWRRGASDGISTAVRAGTRCELEPSNVTTTSSCHLQVPLARCQRVDAASRSTRWRRGPSGCSVASVTAAGMILIRGGAARRRWTRSLLQGKGSRSVARASTSRAWISRAARYR